PKSTASRPVSSSVINSGKRCFTAGWEGTVLLRVHVLASGSPSEIQVQKSSGREALDQAAVKAVKRWSFVPAKRGDKAEDGWVSVPIDFKLN
ncbi:energy transducer TonB, partial [Pseudomonas aeruginosa]|nr:energy transducer TonB [Pseudomonas aeruginosa]